MKKIVLILIIGFVSILNAKINIVVSILPQQTFLKAIGGDKINIALMVKPGSSPHTYEPKPSQMKDISNADIYFTIGVEFEKVWIKRFTTQNQSMQVVDLSNNIIKTKDPHIWVSPKKVKKIAYNIYTTLVKYDNTNKDYYTNNYNAFLEQINTTDETIKSILKDVPSQTKFMVFHPSWGYFAQDYNLVQLAIEIDGKSPKPRQIGMLIKEARDNNVKAIFTSPEFSTKVATQIARELNINVIKVSPLNPKWSKNLINFAKGLK